MKPSTIYQEFEKLAESLEVKIIQEKGNFKGGYCLLEKEKIIVINKLKPLEQRIKINTPAPNTTISFFMYVIISSAIIGIPPK